MSQTLKELKDGYKSTLKSMDTEETFDLIFYRPLGYACALISKKLHITPNAITIFSIFLGLGAGILFYYNNIWLNLGAMFLLIAADICDSADGQLARMTKQYSRIGRILDGLSGDIWFAAIYIAICLRENVTSNTFMDYPWLIWVMAVVTGLCHATQAAMADYYRQFHLFFVNGPGKSELEDSAAKLWDKFHALSWKRDFWNKLTLMFYTNYTVGQEKRTPMMQKLRRALRNRFGNEIPAQFVADFRKTDKPLMKYTNILSFNVRSFALFASVLIFQMPWLYFAFELTVLNALLVYMMWRHEKNCKHFIKELEDGKY